MPVGINSPARNLFLLGSSGQAAVTNFFETIDQSAGTDGVYLPAEIKYIFSNQKYALAGSAQDSNAVSFGWFERQDYDIETGVLTTDYTNEVVNTQSLSTTLFAMELDANENLIVGGKTGDVPWIAKYSNDGVLDWQSTTNSADVEYSGIASNSSGNYYACGSTQSPNPQQAFVEKFDANGNPGWGKSAFMLGRHVMLDAIDANSRGQVVAVGHLEDDSSFKGYIVKLDTNTGEVLWDRTLDVGDGITLSDVFIDSNDQIYIVGTSLGAAVEGYIFKYTAEGNLIWQRKTNGSSLENFTFDRVKSDGETEQTIVFGTYFDMNGNDLGGVLSKYAKDGSLVWRRTIFSSTNNSDSFSDVCLDADPSFYYLLYVDTDIDGLAGTPDSYTFGQVSSSGNGLGGFQYAEGTGETIDYQILNIGDTISRVSDGAVRNDSSDLITYPFTGNKIVFDDLSTHVTNKKRQMDDADSFEYSGSPAIRPADFQELNLLGNVYSGSGDWLDQSGKGNNAVTSFETTTTLPGTTESENFRTVTSSYSTYGTVAENTVTNDLPYNNADWSHYGGKVRDLQTGGFRIDLTGNSNGSDFFMACWIKFDTYATSRQMGIDLFGNYVYWETLANGAIAVRHNGGSRADSSATSLNDGNWHHIALSRVGNTLHGMLDGSSVVSTTNGVSGSSVGANEQFWFFGGNGNAYITDAKVLDPIVCIGSGTSSYTVPTEPVIDANGTFPNAAPHVPFFSNNWAYISPAISIPGATTTTTTGPTHNAAGYWEFNGTNDYIQLPTNSDLTFAFDFSYETWLWTDVQPASNHIWSTPNDQTFQFTTLNSQQELIYYSAQTGNQSFGPLANNTWAHYVITKSGNTLTGYLNGVQAWTSTPGSSATHNFSGLSIGYRTLNSANTFYWDGRMGEIRIYPRALTAAQVYQNYNATKSKYINEAPETAPKIGPAIVYDSNLLLNYDFGNRATYDRAENLFPVNNDPTSNASGTATKTLVQIKQPTGEIGPAMETDASGFAQNYRNITASSNTAPGYLTFWAKKKSPGSTGTLTITMEGGNTARSFNSASINSDTWTKISTTHDWSAGTSTLRRFDIYFNGSGNTSDGDTSFYLTNHQFEEATSPGRFVRTYGSAITAPTTVKNLSSSSYTGTLNGVTFNSAGHFEFPSDGSTITDITIPNFTGFPGGNQAYSYGFWVRSSGSSADEDEIPFFYGNEATGQALRIRFFASGAITLGHWGGPGYDLDAGVVISEVTQWNHVYETYDGTTNRLYVNGVDVFDDTPNTLSIPTSATLILGHRPTAGTNATNSDFGGDIGELQVYDRALSATEVSQNFNATRGKYGV